MNDLIKKNQSYNTFKISKIQIATYKTSRLVERIRIIYNIFKNNNIKDIYREFIWIRNAECKIDGGIRKKFGIAMITLR